MYILINIVLVETFLLVLFSHTKYPYLSARVVTFHLLTSLFSKCGNTPELPKIEHLHLKDNPVLFRIQIRLIVSLV